jgi:hypothetical protein
VLGGAQEQARFIARQVIGIGETMALEQRNMAILKAEAAHDLLQEAYDLWNTQEIRLSRERLADAIDEVRDLHDELCSREARAT